MDTINGYEALKRMRALRHSTDYYFELHHLTWNERRNQTDGMRKVKRCRLRAALPDDSCKPHPDLFLPYIDLDAKKVNQNRLCRKRLVRYAAFPPHFELVKVDWLTPLADGTPQIINQ